MVTTWRESLACAAGFFNGEGHVSDSGPRGRVELRLSINQVDRFVLEDFHQAVLGIGTIFGPYHDGNPKHQPQYRYDCGGTEAVQAVIALLWPWMSRVKRAQASAAMQADKAWRTRCPHGVVAGKRGGRAMTYCRICHNDYHRAYNLGWRARNKDKERAYARAPGRREYQREYQRLRYRKRLAHALLVAV